MFILLLVCSFIFSLVLQLFFKRSLRKKRERNVSLANNSWVSTQFKLWILEILSVDILLNVCGDFLMASGTRQPEYFFYCNILLQPWSQALGDVILFAFCSIPPLLTKKFYLTQIRTLPFSFATLQGGWVGPGADTYSVSSTVMISCLFGTFFQKNWARLWESKTSIKDLM